MTTSSSTCLTQPQPRPGLSRLSEVVLNNEFRKRWELETQFCLGSKPFRSRKRVEFHEFLALAQLSHRIEPVAANLEDTLQLLFVLRCPVPVMGSDKTLHVLEEAQLHLRYREEAIRTPQPGYSFIEIVQPQGVWLPNAFSPSEAAGRGSPGQVLCLGTSLPPGIRVRELILMAYGALTLQAVQMDALDPAGIMNREAAEWWQRNLSKIPLSTQPFLNSQG